MIGNVWGQAAKQGDLGNQADHQAVSNEDGKPETDLAAALDLAGSNRKELQRALKQAPRAQVRAVQFLIENMPESDLQSLSSEFILEHVKLAFEAREKTPWGKSIPEELFLNDVVAYANVDEKREAWRREMFERCWPLVKDCRTPSEAAQRLNESLFPLINVRYSTKRKKPNQSPGESIDQGLASCTGLSILLSNACRSVCVPARLAGTPRWTNKRGNHTWVEVWDKSWHFTGACEPSKQGLNHGWFVNDAAQARKDSRWNAIYATSFKKTGVPFPLVWAPSSVDVAAVNVTDRYVSDRADKPPHRLMVRVFNARKERVSVPVVIVDKSSDEKLQGKSRDESYDTNDILAFEVQPGHEYEVRVPASKFSRKIETSNGVQTIVDIVLSGDR